MMDDLYLKAKLVEVEAVVITVQPGDTIVLKSKENLHRDHVKELWRWAHEMWPNNKVGVMNGADVEIEIVRPE